MKKIIAIKTYALALFMILSSACKKDYIIGGSPEDINRHVNTALYDVLRNDPLYDTLIQVIDAAGFKDRINEQDITFFAPSDYSIYGYLLARTLKVQATISDTAKFGLDSLKYYMANNIDGTRDSLGMYLIKKRLTYDVLTNTGAFYQTGLAGDSAIVSYEYKNNSQLGYNPVVSQTPRIVYFTHLWYPYDLSSGNPAADIPSNTGVHTLVKVSCIPTKTGIMNALENSHVLFFYGTKQ